MSNVSELVITEKADWGRLDPKLTAWLENKRASRGKKRKDVGKSNNKNDNKMLQVNFLFREYGQTEFFIILSNASGLVAALMIYLRSSLQHRVSLEVGSCGFTIFKIDPDSYQNVDKPNRKGIQN